MRNCFAIVNSLLWSILLPILVQADDKLPTKAPDKALVLWLDASHPARGDSNYGSSSKSLAAWEDRSSHKNDVAQDVEAKRPLLVPDAIGGHAAVRFQGDDFLDRGSMAGLSFGDQAFHLVVVFQAPQGGPGAQRIVDLNSRASGTAQADKRHGFWVGFQGNRYIPRLGIHHGDEGEALTPIWDARPHLLELVYRGEQLFEIHVDGRTERRAMFNGTHFLGFDKQITLAIGQHFGMDDHANTFFKGDVAEVLLYSRPLTTPERVDLGRRLTKKYSLETEYESLPIFERDIRPILARHCFECHGEDEQEAGLDLRTVTAMLQGGEAGPVIVRGHPEHSELIAVLESEKMPPDDAPKLSEKEIALLRRWIHADTPAEEVARLKRPPSKVTDEDRQHWAWQQPNDPKPPTAKNTSRVRTDVDRFILAKLEAKGLTLSDDARDEQLVRRVYFDLHGLPPTPKEVDAFLNDKSERRFENLIDRLLSSHHFGERFGRRWLDVVGFVDVIGSDNDAPIIKPLPGKWRYRDYVIRSFNDDKPIDRFLVEQLAGDELYDWRNAKSFSPEMRDALVATGFLLSANDDTDQNELNTPDVRHHVLQRTSENVANALFAVTLQCAKCHDHKYEAISQLDYYRFEATFAPIFNVRNWVVSKSRTRADVSDVVKQEIDQTNAKIKQQTDPLSKRRDELRKVKEPTQKQKGELAGIEKKLSELATLRRSYNQIAVATETTATATTHVLRRGDWLRPGLEVESELFEVFTSGNKPLTLSVDSSAGLSGRRLALARAVTDPDSLAGQHVARVFVNRIWQQLFGRGIVETCDNFGVSGAKPTHPELLDWLIHRFIEGGWRVKPLVRMLMLSSVYRQSAESHGSAAEKNDPQNRLLWRINLRRLDSEQLRDAILTVSGNLDRSLGGPPIPLAPQPDGMVVLKKNGLPAGTTINRRSVYILARRNYHLTLMRVFDQPIVARNCAMRKPSAAVTQSLALLHDDFLFEQAAAFAARAMKAFPRSPEEQSSPKEQIRSAWRIALGRSPSDDELKLCEQVFARHLERYAKIEKTPHQKALAEICHMLLNTNEFLYVP